MTAYEDDETRGLPAEQVSEVTDVVHLPKYGFGSRSLTKKGRARDGEALRLKALGYSLEEIADALGLSGDPSRAAAAIRRALGSVMRFATDEHRALELESYDELEVLLWRQLRASHHLVDRGTIVIGIDGLPVTDDRFVLETVDRILKIKERRAKLLGLDAPVRSEVITIDSIDAEIAKLKQELNEVGVPLDDAEVVDGEVADE